VTILLYRPFEYVADEQGVEGLALSGQDVGRGRAGFDKLIGARQKAMGHAEGSASVQADFTDGYVAAPGVPPECRADP
jgi:hypothetical protein